MYSNSVTDMELTGIEIHKTSTPFPVDTTHVSTHRRNQRLEGASSVPSNEDFLDLGGNENRTEGPISVPSGGNEWYSFRETKRVRHTYRHIEINFRVLGKIERARSPCRLLVSVSQVLGIELGARFSCRQQMSVFQIVGKHEGARLPCPQGVKVCLVKMIVMGVLL